MAGNLYNYWRRSVPLNHIIRRAIDENIVCDDMQKAREKPQNQIIISENPALCMEGNKLSATAITAVEEVLRFLHMRYNLVKIPSTPEIPRPRHPFAVISHNFGVFFIWRSRVRISPLEIITCQSIISSPLGVPINNPRAVRSNDSSEEENLSPLIGIQFPGSTRAPNNFFCSHPKKKVLKKC